MFEWVLTATCRKEAREWRQIYKVSSPGKGPHSILQLNQTTRRSLCGLGADWLTGAHPARIPGQERFREGRR